MVGFSFIWAKNEGRRSMTAHQKKWNGRMVAVPVAPIISVNEARKILGKQYKVISDDDLMLVIAHMRTVAEGALASVLGSKKQEGVV